MISQPTEPRKSFAPRKLVGSVSRSEIQTHLFTQQFQTEILTDEEKDSINMKNR